MSLKIAVLGSNFIRIPPTPPEKYVPAGYSGAPEMIMHQVTEGLVNRGHTVTLFASGDSQTSARLVSVTKEATALGIGPGPHLEYERVLISKAYQMALAGEFDVIHSHFDTQTAHFAPLVHVPTVSTLHSPLNGLVKDILQNYAQTQYYASISNNQRLGLPELNYIATCYNGIDMASIPVADAKEGYFIMAGRVVAEKGVAEGIEVAQQTQTRLHIYGSVDESSAYWQEKIKPHIDGKLVIYGGLVSQSQLREAMSKAKALLFPIQWEEPFGLVMVEAMACGTPVIALRRGSVSEIVIDGRTGFIVDTIEEMVKAVSRLSEIKTSDCRQRAQDNFSTAKMVADYETAYYKILEQDKKKKSN
ncbi:MAG: glycosyltransferase family 4 protein [Candidatus Andersenbacteria bacterium]|nr:glycosyltransferase family 4 protein [Candidatus Andersenbacteria bacterium]